MYSLPYLLCRIALELLVDPHDLRSGDKRVIKVKDVWFKNHCRSLISVVSDLTGEKEVGKHFTFMDGQIVRNHSRAVPVVHGSTCT